MWSDMDQWTTYFKISQKVKKASKIMYWNKLSATKENIYNVIILFSSLSYHYLLLPVAYMKLLYYIILYYIILYYIILDHIIFFSLLLLKVEVLHSFNTTWDAVWEQPPWSHQKGAPIMILSTWTWQLAMVLWIFSTLTWNEATIAYQCKCIRQKG